jgi:hypothetical protein
VPESEDVYKSMDEVSEELPDNTPRYVLLSYPLTLVGHNYTMPFV